MFQRKILNNANKFRKTNTIGHESLWKQSSMMTQVRFGILKDLYSKTDS